MPHRISRNYSTDAFSGNPTLDQKILIFEDRVLFWHLEIAERLREQIESAENGSDMQHAGFALLNLLFTYFEMIAQYSTGRSSDGRSKEAFREGVEEVFPGKFALPEIDAIYRQVRCGMYHSGFVKQGVLISGDYPDLLSVEQPTAGSYLVKANPHKLSPHLNSHFRGVIGMLKDHANGAQRSNFEAIFG